MKMYTVSLSLHCMVIATILKCIKFSLRNFFLKCSVLFRPVVDFVTLIFYMLMHCMLVK